MKQIERTVIRQRNALIKSGRRLFANAIKEQYEQALRIIERTDISQMKQAIEDAVKPDPIDNIFSKYYSGAADIAMTWRKYHKTKHNIKSEVEDELYVDKFKRYLSNYAKTRAAKRVLDMTKTTEDIIIRAVESSIEKGFAEGYGVQKIKDMILQSVRDNYIEMTPNRAKLIAQTESITAASQATMEGTKSLGYAFRKFWSISGKGNSRESHVNAENDSIAKGGYPEDEEFANGLKYPGDPDGSGSSPEEICNCGCGVLTEIV